ncbi:MAG: ABC transporter [Alphaproteobacteria bacterium]|nr:ABC transporter [Alphaproteobacteria bacterium]
MNRRPTFAAVAALLTAIGFSGAAEAQQEPLRIGLMLPYKGIYAQLAEGIDKGWKLALEEWGNKAGGRMLEVIRVDDENNPTGAIQKANKLVKSDRVDILAGVVSSGVGIAMSKFALTEQKPLVLTFAVADQITGELCNAYTARTLFSANAYQSGAGMYWAKQGMKTAVTLGPDYAAGRAMLDGFKRGFEAGGGKVMEMLWSDFQKTKDWGPLLTRAKDSGAQMIYSFYGGSESIQVVKQHSEFGLKRSLPLHGDQWLYDETLFDAMGEAALGARYFSVATPDAPHEGSKKFVAAYKKKYNEEPDVNASAGYENIVAILHGIDKSKGQVSDGAAFIKTLQSVTFEGPRGKFYFNKDNNAQLDQLFLVEVVKQPDGKLTRKLVETVPGGKDLPGCKMGS